MDWKKVCALDTRASKADLMSDVWDGEYSCSYSSDGTKLLDAENFPDRVSVRQGTKVICDGAFAFQDYMSDRRIGEEVPEDERVSYLEKIFLPEGLTHIGKESFRECGWMRSIRLPAGLLYIGESAFAEFIEQDVLSLHGLDIVRQIIKHIVIDPRRYHADNRRNQQNKRCQKNRFSVLHDYRTEIHFLSLSPQFSTIVMVSLSAVDLNGQFEKPVVFLGKSAKLSDFRMQMG